MANQGRQGLPARRLGLAWAFTAFSTATWLAAVWGMQAQTKAEPPSVPTGIGTQAATAATSPQTLPPAALDSGAAPAPRRLREGTEVSEVVGYFRPAGERLAFCGPGGAEWIALENLGLERVARTVAAQPGRIYWRVSGRVTEYQGHNFLLLERAVQRAEPPHPTEVDDPEAGGRDKNSTRAGRFSARVRLN